VTQIDHPSVENNVLVESSIMSNETEICVTEMQLADMCVTEAEELSCSPCIEGAFSETYPLAFQAHFQDFLETSKGAAGPTLCVKQEESLCRCVFTFSGRHSKIPCIVSCINSYLSSKTKMWQFSSGLCLVLLS